MFDHFPGLAWPAPYGTMLVLAGIMSWRLARRRVAAMAIDASHVDLALPLSLALGAAAAWGLDAAIPQESQLAGEQLQLERRLRLPLLAMAALPVLLAYCRVVGVPFRRFVDGLAPGSLLSIAVLRIGCFLGGCCSCVYGSAYSSDLASNIDGDVPTTDFFLAIELHMRGFDHCIGSLD